MSSSRNESVEYIYTAFITLKNGKQGIFAPFFKYNLWEWYNEICSGIYPRK